MWYVWAVAGLVFLILEMLIPSMFFLNFSAAAFIVAICSVYITDLTALVIIFTAISLISLLFLRPLLVKKTHISQETGINAKYIGKTAKVIEPVTDKSGVISIYDERWQARTTDGEIPSGSNVVIERNESLVMFVRRI